MFLSGRSLVKINRPLDIFPEIGMSGVRLRDNSDHNPFTIISPLGLSSPYTGKRQNTVSNTIKVLVTIFLSFKLHCKIIHDYPILQETDMGSTWATKLYYIVIYQLFTKQKECIICTFAVNTPTTINPNSYFAPQPSIHRKFFAWHGTYW